jgi:hypothetical protein
VEISDASTRKPRAQNSLLEWAQDPRATMSSITIMVEPLAAPAQRPTGRPGRHSAQVGLIADPRPVDAQAPDLIDPIVGFRNWRIFRNGPATGTLSSPYFPVAWSEPVLRAECRRWHSAEELLQESHVAPDPACGCGISAYHAPTDDFSKVDFRAVSGIVTVWGRIEVDRDEMRVENARVEALGVYARWGRRQRHAVQAVAEDLGVDVVDLRALGTAAKSYGESLPTSLLADQRPKGTRDRFSALFAQRVGD